MKEVKSFFDIVNICFKKTPKPSNEEIKKHTSQWMINNLLSCDKDLVFLASELTKIKISNKEYFDLLYYGLPKINKFIKYSANKIKTEEEIQYIMDFFSVNRQAAKEYRKIIDENELKTIIEYFSQRGIKK